jgi:2-dehydropantoate 2-reductase
LTAILRVRNNEIGATSLKEIRQGIIEECSLVAEAEGVHFEQGLETEVDRKIRGYTNYSSMYQDVAKGKKTEIDFLNGKIVELGRKHGIRTPVNETLVGLIRFMEARK